jgi:putative flippase GtrA
MATTKIGMTNLSLIVRLVGTAVRSDRFRLVRYAIAGTAVSLGYTFTIVALVSWWSVLSPQAANVVSLILWTIISYFAHREFTFRFAGEYAGSAARFIFVSLLRLGASIAVVAVVTRYYQSSYLIGVLINWVILPLVSYIALKLWAFRWGPVESAPVRVVGYSPFDGN